MKDYALDSLMSNFSMVFQTVYLFNDSIENNIKFGKPDATHDEVVAAAENGTLEEAFGTGTAAVISPIGELIVDDKTIKINGGEIGEVSHLLYDTIVGIQNGKVEDTFGWIKNV